MKPLLACSKSLTEADLPNLRYPLIASPKFDGIRCLTFKGGLPKTRKLKDIPNLHVRDTVHSLKTPGLDGELIIPGAKDFGEVSSAIMSGGGTPTFEYWVFDAWDAEGHYLQRLDALAKRMQQFPVSSSPAPFVKFVRPHVCHDQHDLLMYEVDCLEDGFEGVITRCPHGRYKHGRSTRNEQIMLKLKRFEDSEAKVIGFIEEQANLNEAKVDALGHTERSTHQENKVGKGTLGKLICVDLVTGIEFGLGTGYSAPQRKKFWKERNSLIGRIVKYKYQPAGAQEAPRFPGFLGFRHEDDL
jgi:DNA ligase-1